MVLLISVFSVAGIIACGGEEDIVGSRGGDYIVEPEPTEPEEPEQPAFGEDTYYTVYTRFRGEYNPKVSYKDTNTLIRYWKEMMGRKDEELKGNSRRWFIRDGDNRAKVDDPSIRNGNHYYYFDKNFDLVYYRQGRGFLRIRELVGAVIVKYYRGSKADTYTVAGLYQI